MFFIALRTYYNAESAYSWKTHSVVGVKKCNVKKSESLSGFHSPFFPIIDLSPFLALPLVPPTEQKCCGLFLQYFLSIFFGLLSIKTSFQNVRNLLGMVSLLQRWIIVVGGFLNNCSLTLQFSFENENEGNQSIFFWRQNNLILVLFGELRLLSKIKSIFFLRFQMKSN